MIGGATNPVPAETLDGERVGFQAYSNGVWGLYGADANQGDKVGKSEPPSEEIVLEPFVPAVSITVDPEKGELVKRRKFYLEDVGAYVGVDTTNQILGQAYFTFSDQYGDRRIQIFLDSVDTFSNFLVSYYNLEPRLQWGIQLYDSRSYYITGYDPLRLTVNRETGGLPIHDRGIQPPLPSQHLLSVGGPRGLSRPPVQPTGWVSTRTPIRS